MAKVEILTVVEAIAKFQAYGLELKLTSPSTKVKGVSFIGYAYDHRHLPGYLVGWTCQIVRSDEGYDGEVVERFNIAK